MRSRGVEFCCMLAVHFLMAGSAIAQVVTEFTVGLTIGANPSGITAGPDGNLWFTEFAADRIGRITPGGVVTEFSAGISSVAFPYGNAAGPDGNLWFTENAGGRIGKITPLGVVTEFSADVNSPFHPVERGVAQIAWRGRVRPAAVVAAIDQPDH